MLESRSVFKASLIASPALRQHVESQLGWPVYAVAWGLVVKELENSGYPRSVSKSSNLRRWD